MLAACFPHRIQCVRVGKNGNPRRLNRGNISTAFSWSHCWSPCSSLAIQYRRSVGPLSSYHHVSSSFHLRILHSEDSSRQRDGQSFSSAQHQHYHWLQYGLVSIVPSFSHRLCHPASYYPRSSGCPAFTVSVWPRGDVLRLLYDRFRRRYGPSWITRGIAEMAGMDQHVIETADISIGRNTAKASPGLLHIRRRSSPCCPLRAYAKWSKRVSRVHISLRDPLCRLVFCLGAMTPRFQPRSHAFGTHNAFEMFEEIRAVPRGSGILAGTSKPDYVPVWLAAQGRVSLVIPAFLAWACRSGRHPFGPTPWWFPGRRHLHRFDLCL